METPGYQDCEGDRAPSVQGAWPSKEDLPMHCSTKVREMPRTCNSVAVSGVGCEDVGRVWQGRGLSGREDEPRVDPAGWTMRRSPGSSCGLVVLVVVVVGGIPEEVMSV